MAKTFALLEPASPSLIAKGAKADPDGFERKAAFYSIHPQEDYFFASEKYPIWSVGDGVTLEANEHGGYPEFSGAGEVAKLLCEKAVYKGEELYESFDLPKCGGVFRAANAVVQEYNRFHGRTRPTINFWDRDFFAAAGAFALLKANRLFWFTIGDAEVRVFDREGKKKFVSPECWPDRKKFLPPDWAAVPPDKKRRIIREFYRNGVDKEGRLIGYGVVTGEEMAERYLKSGALAVETGDLLFLATDGFAPYLDVPEFVGLFLAQTPDLSEKVRAFTRAMSEREPERFGHERTLIAAPIAPLADLPHWR